MFQYSSALREKIVHSACSRGWPAILKFLTTKCGLCLKKFEDHNLLHTAAFKGYLHLIKYLVEECGYNPHAVDEHSKTVFDIAIDKGHMTVINFVICQCYG